VPHLSHSQLSMLLRCPRQWEYRYCLGLRIPTAHMLALGSSFHRALEVNFVQKVDTRVDLPTQEVLDAFSDDWERRLQREEVVFGDEKPGQVKDVGIGLVAAYQETTAPTVQPCMVERPFEIALAQGYTLKGQLDLLTEDLILDHKTSAKAWNQGRADEELQPTAYLLACQELGLPHTEFEYHVAVKTKEPRVEKIRTRRSQAEIDWYLRVTRDAIRLMNTGIFLPAPPGSWVCSENMCGYRHLCKPWTRP
jgi:CRISPR/Cas system-associated exonuclease Cas4 (RecB family)